ncbi:hypothetical protein AMTRI_Chr09g15770 [Amborella trichopoda]|uniref:uncharacterized protein LOC105421800 n=1 Tax=Amborella trichopoda TaxID=13333 RepID=UPI0005D32B16|nr:uncharacterized protein LOC105421800 [Amborella trichopoda]|eukprot:XP_020517334.1 uncharacterized protein LOC105421800 [Amborella trichopoda]
MRRIHDPMVYSKGGVGVLGLRDREKEMITRSNLAEQLREYQTRSKYEWASASFFSSTSNFGSNSRVDMAISVLWELFVLTFLVFSAISLYFRYMRLAFCLICIATLVLICLKITRHVKLARKRKRRMLLPLSM